MYTKNVGLIFKFRGNALKTLMCAAPRDGVDSDREVGIMIPERKMSKIVSTTKT